MLRAIILVVALAAGSLAAWLVLSMQPGGAAVPPQAAPVQQATAEVLVATGDLALGHVIEAKSLRWQAWPKEALNPTLITRSAKADAMTSLVGAVVRGRFVAGEPILEEKLSRNQSGMLAAMLPAGKRAVAIRISAESTAGGFILPNDRVDVIQNIVRQEGGQSEHRSRTLLSNIRVLAVDQQADDGKGQAVVGKTATLELSPSQVEIIVSGQVAGTLSLALRSAADSDEKIVVAPEGGMVRILRAGRSEIVRVQ
jgi:pilus assembly protein CpaB